MNRIHDQRQVTCNWTARRPGPVWQLATPLGGRAALRHGDYIKGDAAHSSWNTRVVTWHTELSIVGRYGARYEACVETTWHVNLNSTKLFKSSKINVTKWIRASDEKINLLQNLWPLTALRVTLGWVTLPFSIWHLLSYSLCLVKFV